LRTPHGSGVDVLLRTTSGSTVPRRNGDDRGVL
jgi:hypothetical protein